MTDLKVLVHDPFLRNYQSSELQIAFEFLSNWLPFLSRDLCQNCAQTLCDRVHSLETPESTQMYSEETIIMSSPANMKSNEWEKNNEEYCDTHSLGSSKDSDGADTNSLGSWKSLVTTCPKSAAKPSSSTSEMLVESPIIHTPSTRMSWADMAQEEQVEEEQENEVHKRLTSGTFSRGETMPVKVRQKTELSREQREYIRFMNVRRKKDFVCFERIKGKLVNILEGLELHTGVFSAAEQKRIIDCVYDLQDQGKNGQLKERTYTAPQKWMRGKGRITIQFGCCYNYALDKNGNPPGILQNEMVDPIPHLFKVIIRRLVAWHVLPSSCVPDSCIVNIYEEGDCIPPHIDNHDFVRPFCTVSFLSQCNILFGSNLKIVGPGDFEGSFAIPLPVGSVLVLNGNGADIAKHCVPAVPTKRISITFRKMDESKRPIDFVPEPDLQGLQPLSYEGERSGRSNLSKSERPIPNNRQSARKNISTTEEIKGSVDRGGLFSEPRYYAQNLREPPNRRRLRVNLGSA